MPRGDRFSTARTHRLDSKRKLCLGYSTINIANSMVFLLVGFAPLSL